MTSSPGPDAERVQDELDGGRAVRDADRLGRLAERRELLLERLRLGSVDEGLALEHAGDRGLDLGADRAVLRLQVDERDGVHRCAHGRSGIGTRAPPFACDALAASSTSTTLAASSKPVTGSMPERDAVDEVAALERERLVQRDPRDVHVADALDQPELAERLEVGERAVDALAVDAGVVHDDLALDVVVDDHLLAADHRHPPHLARVQPADVDVSDGVLVLEHEEGQVGDARLEVVVGVAVDGLRVLPQPVVQDRDVVGREVPDRVDVAAHAAQVQALGVDRVDLAELLALEQAADVVHERAEPERVARP